MAVAIAAVAIAGGLSLTGSASAAVIGDATSATVSVSTPDGSFHIPVVPYPTSGAFNTPFTLYTLPACSSTATFYEVFISTLGVEQDFTPPAGSTLVLRSDSSGLLFGRVGANGALPTPFNNVDFSVSGLNGFIAAAGDYSIGVKCLNSAGITDAWWTTVDFDGPASSTNAPNWTWEPLDSI
jgi:hypothetical protein